MCFIWNSQNNKLNYIEESCKKIHNRLIWKIVLYYQGYFAHENNAYLKNPLFKTKWYNIISKTLSKIHVSLLSNQVTEACKMKRKKIDYSNVILLYNIVLKNITGFSEWFAPVNEKRYDGSKMNQRFKPFFTEILLVNIILILSGWAKANPLICYKKCIFLCT